jgi:cytochrome c-type biogenesis protein CcmH/NrfG
MVQSSECRRCGAQIVNQMRFCSACGKRVASRSKGFTLGALVCAAVLLGGGLGLQWILRGTKPKQVAGHGQQEVNPEVATASESTALAAMRQEVERAPDDLAKLKVFAGMLGDTLRNNPGASSALVFEAIDVFGRILQREPNDPTALVLMADLSFDQRAFTKALDFYERYLQVDPKDLGARSRYASTLTFLGRYDDSIRELQKVLSVDAKNFPAMAYLAITYAQKGDTATAKKVGGDALAIAPSQDARARFSAFVASLDQTAPQGAIGAAPDGAQEAVGDAGGLVGLEEVLRSNPVAGPKFVRYELLGATLKLVYRDFPMGQMPPFAKDKFLGGIKSALTQKGVTGVSSIVFTDEETGSTMESIALSKSP